MSAFSLLIPPYARWFIHERRAGILSAADGKQP